MPFKSISSPEENPNVNLDTTLLNLFSETLKKFPHKEACIFNDQSISYQELEEKSNAIAQQLLDLQIPKGSIIGVYLERGILLHATILGVLKSGLAYVPFDIETPKERLESIFSEIGICYCLSFSEFNSPITSIQPTKGVLTKSINFSRPDDLAYIIFTSGSTGKPKGIPITHRQISILIQSENTVLQIENSDRVYQGFSVSFDMWFEETWLSFLVGATIIIADSKTAKSIDSLHGFLARNEISILHAVPSLLAIVDSEIPSIRLVNSGGEACNQNIVHKWYRPNRLFYNSYGPTETTVSSCMTILNPGDEITVGKPLPYYGMAVVNENLEPVNIGEEGQLIVSGPCVSAGYLHRLDLTEKAFLPKPTSLESMIGDRIYLSGDHAKMTKEGNFIVLGRKDDQIKLRGYRIELGEIEAQLNALSEVKQAVLAVKKWHDLDQLVAYIIPNQFDETEVRSKLSKLLPNYMIPSFFELVESFPFLPSGKVDKKQLPNPIAFDKPIAVINEDGPIYGALHTLFPGKNIQESDDFFDDLGGYSMLAAQFVSQVREIAGFEQISIMDVYENRPLNSLIRAWEGKKGEQKEVEATSIPSRINYILCGFAQLISLFFIFGIVAAQIFIPFLGYYMAVNELESHLLPLLFAVILYCTVVPTSVLLIWLIKKLLIGNLIEGDYPLWGKVYFRWWLQKRLYSLIPKEVLSNTPLYAHLISALGVNIKSKTQLSHFEIGVEELVEIGQNVTISSHVVLNNAFVEKGKLKLRKIHISNDAYLGTSCVVSGSCHIGIGGELKDLSMLKIGERIPDYEIYEGSPAKPIGKKEPYEKAIEPAFNVKIGYYATFVVLVFLFPILVLIPLVPSIISLYYLDEQADWYSFYYLFKTPIFAFLYILLFLTEVILLTRIFQKDLQPGNYSIYSKTYLKKWFLDQLFSLSLLVIKPLFATVFISRIYRALGAKVGRNTEISTATNVTHSLLKIGNESFIADDVSIGETEVRNQELQLDFTQIGNRSFVGNSALIPQGYTLGDSMLVGVISLPPSPEQMSKNNFKDWFGSPSRPLPNREVISHYPASLTYSPPYIRKIARAIVEFIRILIPQSAILAFSIFFIAYTDDLLKENKWSEIFFYFPFYYLGMVAIPCFILTWVLKWVFIGRYKIAQHPMWTWDVWKTEAVTSIYESLAIPFFLDYLRGTPFIALFFRSLGVKVGKMTYLDTTDITEFDLVQIGNYTEINLDAGPQTHLFEDRIMKVGSVAVGDFSTIGARSVLLFGTEIGENCKISALSLVMKGEKIQANTTWEGIPIK